MTVGIHLSSHTQGCHIAATPSLSKHWVNTSATITSTWRQHYVGPKPTGKIDKPAKIRKQMHIERERKGGRVYEKPMSLALGQQFLPNKLFYLPRQRTPAAAGSGQTLNATWHIRMPRRLFMKMSLKYSAIINRPQLPITYPKNT